MFNQEDNINKFFAAQLNNTLVTILASTAKNTFKVKKFIHTRNNTPKPIAQLQNSIHDINIIIHHLTLFKKNNQYNLKSQWTSYTINKVVKCIEKYELALDFTWPLIVTALNLIKILDNLKTICTTLNNKLLSDKTNWNRNQIIKCITGRNNNISTNQ